MTTHESSTGPRRDGSARDAVESAAYDITDAIEALRPYVAFFDGDPDDATFDPDWDGLTLGHLRAILAALSAPYVPGMVEVEHSVWAETANQDRPTALLSVMFDQFNGSTHKFAEVSR